METTGDAFTSAAREHWREQVRLEGELAELSAHLNAATARWLELAWTYYEGANSDDFAGFLGYRCGITRREAQEFLRVAEALQELPATRAAFSRGELTYTKVRALTRVATAASEEGLLELAGALTASQLERALRVYRRVTAADARETHELEFVSHHFDEDGSLYLRARLAAEDGTLLVKALDAAHDRVLERRREERAAAAKVGDVDADPLALPPREPRSARVEALLELADAALSASDDEQGERARVVVHVDAVALASDAGGRSELDDGPVIAPETARRLGCDAEVVAQVERDGLPVSAGRKRRTVPPALRGRLHGRGRPGRRASRQEPPRSRPSERAAAAAPRERGRPRRRKPKTEPRDRPADEPARWVSRVRPRRRGLRDLRGRGGLIRGRRRARESWEHPTARPSLANSQVSSRGPPPGDGRLAHAAGASSDDGLTRAVDDYSRLDCQRRPRDQVMRGRQPMKKAIAVTTR
jgi:hypothetical protein